MSYRRSEAVPAEDGPATTTTLSPAKTNESSSSLPAGRTASDAVGQAVRSPDPDAVLAAAHDYSKRGWRVLALYAVDAQGRCGCGRASCNSQGKHPVETGWQNTPLLSGADVQATFEDGGRNLGVATGHASGVWVLDVDLDKPGAAERWEELLAAHGGLPATRVVRTPAGWHYWFTMPADFTVTNSNRLPDGIDTRGAGGQVVAPPSVSAKGPYRVHCDAPIADAPDWLLEYVRPAERPGRPQVDLATLPKLADLPAPEQERMRTYTDRAVAAETERLTTAGNGKRNDTTFRVACNLVELANSPWCPLTMEEAHVIVSGSAPVAGDFTADEVARCWGSARDRVGDKGRPYPEDRPPDQADAGDPLSDPTARGGAQGGGSAPVAGLESSTGEPARQRRVRLVPAPTEVRPTHWLWEGRLPMGSLTLLAGREGIGKSTAAYTIAAQVTRGTLPGRHEGKPAGVVVCATEDSWAHTITPRLLAAGADMSLVFLVDVQTAEGFDGTLSLPNDLPELERELRDAGFVLMLLDPLLSRLDATLDTHKDAEVRRALEPLTAFADRTGCAVYGIIHVNKATTTDPLNSIMGSRAFSAVARCVQYVVTDSADSEVRLLGIPKNNLGRANGPSLRFRLEDCKVADTDEGPVHVGRLQWDGEDVRTVADVMTDAQDSLEVRSQRGECADWLQNYLINNGGAADSSDIKKAAYGAGYSDPVLRRARQALKVEMFNVPASFPRRTTWQMPGTQVESQ